MPANHPRLSTLDTTALHALRAYVHCRVESNEPLEARYVLRAIDGLLGQSRGPVIDRAKIQALRDDIHRWRCDIDQCEPIDVICEWGDRLNALLAEDTAEPSGHQPEPARETTAATPPTPPTWEEIWKLPRMAVIYGTVNTEEGNYDTCRWCRLEFRPIGGPHPDNGCLYARAHTPVIHGRTER
jgi:hypothetical protein